MHNAADLRKPLLEKSLVGREEKSEPSASSPWGPALAPRKRRDPPVCAWRRTPQHWATSVPTHASTRKKGAPSTLAWADPSLAYYWKAPDLYPSPAGRLPGGAGRAAWGARKKRAFDGLLYARGPPRKACARRSSPHCACRPKARRQPYSSSCVNIATPRFVQYFSLSFGLIGSIMVITKFVECPVVDNTPRRSDVL